MEIWKDVVGYEGIYQISNLGNVKSLDRNIKLTGKNQFTSFQTFKKIKGKNITKAINKKGYYQICLYKNGKRKNMLVHILVAQAFLDNPLNKPTVNHKNGNTIDNNVKNLEWATMSEQQIHRNYILGHKSIISDKCRKKQIELNQRKVKRSDGIVFNSIKEASNGDDILRRHISSVCKNKRKTAGGYGWQYI